MRVLELIAWIAGSLALLVWTEIRYRRGVYGPLQEVQMLVGMLVLLGSLGSLGRLGGL
jgi:hypothetical protein